MHIDSYQFGKIVVDGQVYSSDLILVGGTVRPNWWRKQGHSLAVEDLEVVIEGKPAILVVGCGASGIMKVPEQTRQVLEADGIALEALNTDKAVERFNELTGQGASVAAALHLTC
ncbi:MAG: Mth938-like domain-containing protein [Planctomycetota bacterium]|jgi:hypothetical protein